jgi:RHS repeat-associated protein
VAARYHYDAWGRYRDEAELDASANRFGFTGHYFDTETKLYYAKARYFDHDFGRFLTKDSYLGEIGDPPSLHRYLYAKANPARFTDPSGHFSLDSFKQRAQEGLIFGIATGVHFQEEAGKAYDRFIDRTAMLLVPGATARQRIAAGQDPGLAGGVQLRLLDAARNPELSIRTRFDAFTEAVKAQPAVVAEETIVRPVQEAPGRARAAGIHLAQAATATSAVESAVHVLEATKEAAEAFTGFAGPAALATGVARGGPTVVADEFAVSRPTLRALASTEESQASSQVGRGQQVFHEGEGVFVRGAEGEFVYAEGTLGDVAAPRDIRAQAEISGKLPGDQAGHALAARFGFTGKAPNLVPMAPELNLSAFKKLENHLARLKADGRTVTLEVWGVPGLNPQRPDRFFVIYTIDGKAATATFDNPAPGVR